MSQSASRNAAEACADGGAPGTVLRLLGGLHQGALRPLLPGDVLVIGSGADCDVILADEGVAVHHCILTWSGTEASLRAVDAAVFVGDRCIAPGEPRSLPQYARVVLGDAVLAIGHRDSPRWQHLLDASAPRVRARPRGLRPLWAALAATLVLGAGALAYAISQRQPLPDLGEQQRALVALLAQLGLNEAEVRLDEAGQSVVHGIVPTQASADALRAALEARQIPASVALRSGDELAADVREVFRLSGVTVETRYLGEGRVEVLGHLGDEAQLQSLIGSRALREVDGLRQIVAVNLDRPPPPAPAQIADGKQIVAIVPGDDPYVVTADGSRYYLGATLPDGSLLSSIEGQTLVVEREGKQQRRSLAPQPPQAADFSTQPQPTTEDPT